VSPQLVKLDADGPQLRDDGLELGLGAPSDYSSSNASATREIGSGRLTHPTPGTNGFRPGTNGFRPGTNGFRPGTNSLGRKKKDWNIDVPPVSESHHLPGRDLVE